MTRVGVWVPGRSVVARSASYTPRVVAEACAGRLPRVWASRAPALIAQPDMAQRRPPNRRCDEKPCGAGIAMFKHVQRLAGL